MPKKEVNKTEQKMKKDNKRFFKDFKAELKKVIWPTPKQLVNNTVAVITIVLITALIVFVLDFAFKSINEYGINNLKEIVQSQQEENTNNEVGNTTNTETENNTESNNETAENKTENTATNTTNANAENK